MTLELTANLVSIPNQKTYKFVKTIVEQNSWIGLAWVGGNWHWPDGSIDNLQNWATKPNEYFVEIIKSYDESKHGKWEALSSENKKGAICQYDITGKLITG